MELTINREDLKRNIALITGGIAVLGAEVYPAILVHDSNPNHIAGTLGFVGLAMGSGLAFGAISEGLKGIFKKDNSEAEQTTI